MEDEDEDDDDDEEDVVLSLFFLSYLGAWEE